MRDQRETTGTILLVAGLAFFVMLFIAAL